MSGYECGGEEPEALTEDELYRLLALLPVVALPAPVGEDNDEDPKGEVMLLLTWGPDGEGELFEELLAGDLDFCRNNNPAPEEVEHNPVPLMGMSASVRCWWYKAAAAAAAAYGVAGGVYGPGAPETLDGGGGALMFILDPIEPLPLLPEPLLGELEAAAAAAVNMLVLRLGQEKALLVGGGTLAAALAQPLA